MLQKGFECHSDSLDYGYQKTMNMQFWLYLNNIGIIEMMVESFSVVLFFL